MESSMKVSFIIQSCFAVALFITGISAVGAADPSVPSSQAQVVNAPVNQMSMTQYYAKPFANNSLWNSKPISPSFSNFVIPLAKYNPLIDSGIYSSGCFFADHKSGSMTVETIPGQKGVYDADAEINKPQIVIPHWPADLEAASGTDGHADIYDVSNGVIHSFWRLKNINGVWTASLYGWAPMDGSGWGDPAHYYHGARAVGIGACAGMIRKKEFLSNDAIYPHALAMSLDRTGAAPGYIFPATSADTLSAINLGQIPEGALVMLPTDFDVSKIKTPELIKIVNTLKVYGAYVVDGNQGTPFVIYAESGSGLSLHKNGYNMKAANELHVIRQSLRMVTSVKYYIDANGTPFTPEKNLNILSMRGPWCVYQRATCVAKDPSAGKFDTWKQAIVFGQTTTNIVQSNSSGRPISQVVWAKPKAGDKYKLTAVTTGGGKLRLILKDKKYSTRVDTYDLADGQSRTFVWPADDVISNVVVTSGVGASSTISGTLLRITK